ncbi:ribbon-helix-helix domain-containing protein [Lacibacterium aquatile]|uniref:Ribbon-helix-helix domain-containing protein n=1 Tax=Lacibacterium aquatile TaxID=1168082 RepID=A0ABW5DKI9_9PROT
MGRHRTSLRLEPEIWAALFDIALAEGCEASDLVARLRDRVVKGQLSASVRVFVVSYYRAKAEKLAPLLSQG